MFLIHNNEIINTNKFTVKLIYLILVSQNFKQPTCLEKWIDLGFNISWKPVWKFIHYYDKSNEFIELDFKIAHNIIFTYCKLYKYGKVLSSQCPVCMEDDEDLCHLFLYCDELYDLISILHEMCIGIFQKTGFSLHQLKRLLLFGCYVKIENCSKEFVNIILSIYRISVFKRRVIAESRGSNINLVCFFKHYMRQFFEYLFNQYRFQNRKHVFIDKYIKNNIFLQLRDDQLIFKYPLENF